MVSGRGVVYADAVEVASLSSILVQCFRFHCVGSYCENDNRPTSQISDLHRSLVPPATYHPLIDPHFKIVLTDLDDTGFFRVRSHVNANQHTTNNPASVYIHH